MAGSHGSYIIAGKTIANEYLALAHLAAFTGIYLVARGSSKPSVTATPPIKASSAEEEEFIKEFLKNAEEEDKKKH
ncbi:hypothetical protein BC936DRAFT_149094 [Jimgerdemannia flammicorona]|uniref:ATP synthase subunit K, mitochondrial n=1 Tax=Jimgerdemannia flammicorona TaxID=994334 RepID=A0A433D1K6_9FUNG|nr:hypothetical protein BC936DRAFT_149094 [Jimgerdemannia flammicorona]